MDAGGGGEYGAGGGQEDSAMMPPPLAAADESRVAAASAAWGVRGVWVTVQGGEHDGAAGIIQAPPVGEVAAVRLDSGAVRSRAPARRRGGP